MNDVYLSLGSNQGDRHAWLSKAIGLLEARCGAIAAKSPIYQSKAWGLEAQPDFLNMALSLKTNQDPELLLHNIRQIEQELGRQRTIKWGPRTLDIDILFYNDAVLSLSELTIPHPYLQDRAFVLKPLADIAPTLMHPIFNKTISQLLAECTDPLEATQL